MDTGTQVLRIDLSVGIGNSAPRSAGDGSGQGLYSFAAAIRAFGHNFDRCGRDYFNHKGGIAAAIAAVGGVSYRVRSFPQIGGINFPVRRHRAAPRTVGGRCGQHCRIVIHTKRSRRGDVYCVGGQDFHRVFIFSFATVAVGSGISDAVHPRCQCSGINEAVGISNAAPLAPFGKSLKLYLCGTLTHGGLRKYLYRNGKNNDIDLCAA